MSADIQGRLGAAAHAAGFLAEPAAVPGVRARWITNSSLLIALLVLVAAIVVLLGWLLDVAAFKSIVPGLATMKANAAAGFAILGSGLALLHTRRVSRARSLARFCGAFSALLGGLTAAQYVMGWNLHIDALLFSGGEAAAGSQFPDRMSPATAVCFLSAGAALALLSGQESTGRQRTADALALVAGLIGVAALSGYLYDASELYRISAFSSMALPTALMFTLVMAGLLTSPPLHGVAALLAGDDIGAAMIRRLLPVALLAPPLIGWLRLLGERAGLYDTAFGIALFATSNMIIFTVVIVRAAVSMRGVDRERRSSESAVHEGEERYRLLIDSIRDYAILMLDRQGRVASWNSGAERIKGYHAEEILGEHLSCFYLPEDVPQLKAERALNEARTSGRYEEDGWRVRKDGSHFWANVVIAAVRDGQGSVQGFTKVTRDITERKRAETDLRDERARLAGLIASAMDAIITADEGQCITLFNPAAERMFGYSAASILGKPLALLLPPPLRPTHGAHVQRFGTTGASSRRMGALGQVLGCRANGEEFPLEATISHIEVAGRKFYTAILRDITERTRLERESREINASLEARVRERTAALSAARQHADSANSYKSEFLASMSHELRTPLNGIIGFAELLVDCRPGPLNPKQKDYLGDILTSGRHLLRLINDVLDLAKIESGKVTIEVAPFRLGQAIAEVWNVAKALAYRKRITVSVDVAADLDEVTLDQQRFKQVLFNLVSNCIKFTEDGGKVSLRARLHGSDCFEVAVQDTGIGIKADDMPRLFGEFEQLESGASRRYEGTGLGLALTRRLVELQGGTIAVASEPGKGSTFSVVLPLKYREGKE